jgi:hypothetical protein
MAPDVEPRLEVLAIELSRDERLRKSAAIDNFPLIADEVSELIAHEGAEFFRSERFGLPAPLIELRIARKPYYETYGEQRVQAGIYSDVIRGAHMRAMIGALLGLLS